MARKTNKVFQVTEEQVKNINEDHIWLMEEFIKYLEAEGKSDTTITVYKSNLNIFFVWFEENCKVKGETKHFSNFKIKDLINFQSYMIKQGLSSARICNIRASISSMSNFIENILAEDGDYPEFEGFRNIVGKLKAPVKEEVREKTILEDWQCQKLLDHLVEQEEYQKACVFAIAWASGRRKSELLRFKVSHIVDENLKFGSIYKTPEKIKTKGKMLNLYILKSKFKPYFDLWMEERERLGISSDVDELFLKITKDGVETLKISTLDEWAEKFSNFLGVDFYFHCMRHNFTTELLKAGIPEAVIQTIVGWSSGDMLRLYDDRDKDDIIGEYFGEDGIKQVESKTLTDI